LAALSYGVWTVYLARPVHLVFELNRFQVVHAVDVPQELLAKAAPGLATEPLLGPTLLSVRPFKNSKENLDVTMAAISGVPLATRPDMWQPYEAARTQILENGKTVAALRQRFGNQIALIDAAVAATGRKPESLLCVPMIARKLFWTVLVDSTSAQVVGYIALDSF
jgi:hypothetical protein